LGGFFCLWQSICLVFDNWAPLKTRDFDGLTVISTAQMPDNGFIRLFCVRRIDAAIALFLCF
jgi:hypothetical protein